MTYRRSSDGLYPISLADLRRMVDIAFGDEPTPEVLDTAGVEPVEAVDAPTPGEGQTVREGAPEQVDGVWRQSWIIEDMLPPATPDTVTMRQARLTLLAAGILANADAAIAALPGVQGEAARIEWDYATALRRDHPLVAGLGQSLGLDDTAIDNLFIQAAQIQ